jgi:hypothetical protein
MPVAMRSKASAFIRCVGGIAGSYPSEGMDARPRVLCT